MVFDLVQPKLCLDVRFELERNELTIDFNSERRARAYQENNPESRIFAEGNNQAQRVWLPILPSMKYLRAGNDGFAVGFASEEAAKRWCDRVIVGRVSSRSKKEVSIVRNWDGVELDELLRSGRTSLRPITPIPSNSRSVTPVSTGPPQRPIQSETADRV